MRCRAYSNDTEGYIIGDLVGLAVANVSALTHFQVHVSDLKENIQMMWTPV